MFYLVSCIVNMNLFCMVFHSRLSQIFLLFPAKYGVGICLELLLSTDNLRSWAFGAMYLSWSLMNWWRLFLLMRCRINYTYQKTSVLTNIFSHLTLLLSGFYLSQVRNCNNYCVFCCFRGVSSIGFQRWAVLFPGLATFHWSFKVFRRICVVFFLLFFYFISAQLLKLTSFPLLLSSRPHACIGL